MSDNSQLEQKIRENAPINREYGLTVKVDVRMVDLEDTNLAGQKVTYKSRMVYLVPQVSTSATMFFDAWLPKLVYKDDNTIMHHEIGVKFSHPIYRVIRCGVCRKNKNYQDAHHLVLMSSESAEDILSGFHGATLQVFVLPGDQGEAAIG
jgi:hypothetical protein